MEREKTEGGVSEEWWSDEMSSKRGHTVLSYYCLVPATISPIAHDLVMWEIIQYFKPDDKAFVINCVVPVKYAGPHYLNSLGPSLGMVCQSLLLFVCQYRAYLDDGVGCIFVELREVGL